MHTKYFLFMITSFILIAFLQMLSCSKEKSLEINSFQEMKEHFANPPAEFRSVPFWVWNDEVTEKKIEEQLTELHSQGIGGVFIHARYGLITPYLSDRWFSLYQFAFDKLKELGMKMWLYDEDGYPSGFAGGYVHAEMPEAPGKILVLRRYNVLPADIKGEVLVVLKKDGSDFVDITNRLKDEKSKSGEYYIYELIDNPSSKSVDLILDGVTEKFLEITVERGYKKYFEHEFGKMIPGIFQDEANIRPRGRNSLKWTPTMFSEFQKKWGYDLKLHLPSLFEEVGNWKKVRHNYYSILLDLFIERWGKVYYQYCEENDLKFTGHYWEHSWPSPSNGPDNMAMYAWAQMPGIDILFNEYGEDTGAQFGNVRSVKEASSVANQMGFSRILSETYGGSGWGLRFEDMKRIGDWEYALGVNFMNEHLIHMTLKGKRKQDWPQSFIHGPYWKFYRTLADYFGRLSMVLSSGEEINKILVIEPTTSGWMYYSPTNPNKNIRYLGDAFQEFITKLSKLQVGYDLGCENIIKDIGKIENGKFVVGERAYEILILPPGLENLNSSMVPLVEKYLQEGGKVISFVETPKYIDGSESDKIGLLASKYSANWLKSEQLNEQVTSNLLTSENFQVLHPENITGILYHLRRQLEDGEFLFLVNTSIEENAAGKVKVKGQSVLELNALNGDITPYPAAVEGGLVTIDFDLPPVGSLLLFISPSSSTTSPIPEDTSPGTILTPTGNLQIQMISPNTLTLDYCDIKLDGKVEKGLYYSAAQSRIFQHHGLKRNPWYQSYQYKTDILDKDKFPANSGFEATFSFQINEGVDKASLQAVAEQPNIFRVSVNGNSVEPRPNEWWLDYSFGIFDIGKYVVNGTNQITLRVSPFTLHAELERIYILGNFGLSPQAKGWEIVPSSQISIGEWHKQDIPFYSDGVAYSKTYNLSSVDKKYFIKLGAWLGTTVEVRVNKEHAGLIAWPPYSLDISDKVRNGENEISVIVYGSLKNLLGPHHNPIRGRTPPNSWDRAPERQPGGEKYDFIGYGLSEDFSVIEK